MPTRRLRDSHPASKNIEQVFALMNKLGIMLETTRDGRVFFHSGGQVFQLLDHEASVHDHYQCMPEIPPMMEWKLVQRNAEEE